MKTSIVFGLACSAVLVCSSMHFGAERTKAFPYTVTDEARNRELSAAMDRTFNEHSTTHINNNELYTQFKYTKLEGFDYSGGDGTISRRDPTKVLFENSKYYVWYTKRNTPTKPMGPQKCTDTIPSTDWDLSDLWFATSKDGFTWEEQGVAVPRPPKPEPGWRSVTTPGILKWKGRFYLYYQAFMEASGKRGDCCPVAVSSANSPDGPWTPANEIVIKNGVEGEWDQFAIHDPCPLVHKGQIYIYYKAAFNRPGNVWICHGIAIGNKPLGPFRKHPLNPIANSGHETTFFPFKEGAACLAIRDGQEHFTIQYAEDWVNFKVVAITELLPTAAGPFVPDAFVDTKDGRGITWGLSHFTNAASDWKRNHAVLARFDCDLSQDVHDPEMKKHQIQFTPEEHYRQRLSKQQRDRALEATRKLRRR